jgi:hypothetical protein
LAQVFRFCEILQEKLKVNFLHLKTTITPIKL